MSENFQKALSRVGFHEKGYSNHPNDPGGETMYGITVRVARQHGYTGEMRFLPKEKADEILESAYWLPIRGDEFPFPIAFQLFDTCVNSGPSQAVKLLQRALNIKDDGVIGPVTLLAAKSTPILPLGLNFIRNRALFQAILPTWDDFGRGWTNRNFDNIEYLLEDCGVTQS